jgi:L-alanine-DL-glutamate epimerase-like enolase superfamily enzyme
MKIIGVETLQANGFGNLVWVLIHTDHGLIGLGETFRNPEATIAYVHETCAPFLLGEDPTHREKLTHSISSRIGNHFNGFPSRSVEVRGNSAVDMALWDLCGKAVGWPLYRLLGESVSHRVSDLQHLRGRQLQQPGSAGIQYRTIQPRRSRAILNWLLRRFVAPGVRARASGARAAGLRYHSYEDLAF